MDLEGVGDMAGGLGAMMERTGDGPVQFAGRIAGLGRDEMAAGIPKWAWFGIGVAGGALLMWVAGDRIKQALRGRDST